MLYIVATPIGNLQDISLRVAQTLFSVDLILCEDTRRAGILLRFIKEFVLKTQDSHPKLLSYHEHNEHFRIPEILSLLQSGKSLALISDAGTPLISDPGFKLIRSCRELGLAVTSIPGPSSVITALTLSGLPSDKFMFLGYLPHKLSHAKTLLERLKKTQELIKVTVIFFEAPHKLLKTLSLLDELFPQEKLVICRELTKIHEEILQGTATEHIKHYTKTKPKGEIVLVLSSTS